MKTLKIILVDDNVQFRSSLRDYLESNVCCKIIGEASDGVEFLKLKNLSLADIVLMDIAMAKMDGIEATKRALWLHSHLKILAITMHSEKVFLKSLIESGFKGCVFKPDIYNQLFPAIDNVLDGIIHFPDNIQFEN